MSKSAVLTSLVGYVGTTPTGVDKLNQYARGGEIEDLSYATKWGVFRTGSWYELTNTLRYQIYTDPITWVDSPYLNDIKFHEHFLTTAVQPYAEFQWVSIPDVTITAGVKDAFYRMNLTQYADGHTIGSLPALEPSTCPTVSATPPALPTTPTGTLASSCTATTQHAQNYNSLLPSIEANYRVNPSASVYIQYGAAASPPSAPSSIPPVLRPRLRRRRPSPTTYQGGTVVKLNRVRLGRGCLSHPLHQHLLHLYRLHGWRPQLWLHLLLRPARLRHHRF